MIFHGNRSKLVRFLMLSCGGFPLGDAFELPADQCLNESVRGLVLRRVESNPIGKGRKMR